MKIDRRSFLSFVIGGAVGTGLSPVAFKILDDAAIWTQNWPWTPVPKKDKAEWVDSICTLCPGSCGISVRKVGNRVVKIEGKKGHPVNDGGICILGLAGAQLLYGPDRIKSPLKQTGKRGSGQWKKISWNQAISEVATKLSELYSQGLGSRLSCISSENKGSVSALLSRFLEQFGSSNYIKLPSFLDSYQFAAGLTQNRHEQIGFDIQNSDYILSFGSGLLDGWGTSTRIFRMNSRRIENKGRLIQIEPRLSNTAAKADKWIANNPGTESALALGIANIIINNSAENKHFIRRYTQDFRKFSRLVSQYTSEKVSEITGIDQTVIQSIAAEFAKAKTPLAICGKGSGDRPGGIDDFLAVQSLNALTGQINAKGGVCNVAEPYYVRKNQSVKFSNSNAKKQNQLLSELINNDNTKALFVHKANPCFSLPDTKAFQKAIQNIPFIVSFSAYMDETAQNADFILPDNNYLESYKDVSFSAGFDKPYIGLAKPVIKPQFNTKNTGDVILKIAKAFGGGIAHAFPWDNHQNYLIANLGREKWNTLKKQGFWIDSNYKPTLKKREFKFPKPEFKPVNIQGDKKQFPLVLIPVDSIRLNTGFTANTPFITKTVPDYILRKNDLLIEINPITAKKLNLKNGKKALLTTPIGNAKVRINLFEGIKPGLIGMPTGLGHTAFSDYLSGKGVNFNQLISPINDPQSGLDSAWGIRARLTAA